MNANRIRELADYIEKQVDRTDFQMTYYTSFRMLRSPAVSKEHVCGSAGCIAGWAWMKDHQDKIKQAGNECLNQLTAEELSKIDYISFKVSDADSDWDGQQFYRDYAQEYLELGNKQALELFCCDYPGTNVWDKAFAELGIDLCDIQDREECDYECELDHCVELSDIDKSTAVEVLRGIADGRFQFGHDFFDEEITV